MEILSNLAAFSKNINFNCLHNLFLGIPGGMTETSSEKDNNKNNLLLAMLWLQRHREIMSLSQQNTDSTTASKVRFLWNEYLSYL